MVKIREKTFVAGRSGRRVDSLMTHEFLTATLNLYKNHNYTDLLRRLLWLVPKTFVAGSHKSPRATTKVPLFLPLLETTHTHDET